TDPPLSTSRYMRRSKNDVHGLAYSITSSARARSVGGMVRPRALATFRLSTRSYLVAAADIDAGTAIGIREARPIAHQSAGHGVSAQTEVGGRGRARSQRQEPVALAVKERLSGYDEPAGVRLCQRCKGFVQVGLGAGIEIWTAIPSAFAAFDASSA